MGEVTPKEVYTSLVQLIIHAENISWNRFNNFLLFNSILVLSWATIAASTSAMAMSRTVLVPICFLGVINGILWAGLGYRGRAFHKKYSCMAKTFETDQKLSTWTKVLPVTATKELLKEFCWTNLTSSLLKFAATAMISSCRRKPASSKALIRLRRVLWTPAFAGVTS